MRKLRLNLDELAVESFDPEPDGERDRGTVRGNAITQFRCTEGQMWGCPLSDDDPTCLISCGYERTRCPHGGGCPIAL